MRTELASRCGANLAPALNNETIGEAGQAGMQDPIPGQLLLFATSNESIGALDHL